MCSPNFVWKEMFSLAHSVECAESNAHKKKKQHRKAIRWRGKLHVCILKANTRYMHALASLSRWHSTAQHSTATGLPCGIRSSRVGQASLR